MREVAEQRIAKLSPEERQLYESFLGLGMKPATALTMTQGREPQLTGDGPTEQFESSFLRDGHAPEKARRMAEIAAEGHGRHGMSLREIETPPTEREASTRTTPLSEGLGLPLTREEKAFKAQLSKADRDGLREAASRVVRRYRLSRTYGAGAHEVASDRLLKEAHRRIREEK